MDQITDLIERLIYRVKQRETLEKKESADKPAGNGILASSNKTFGQSEDKKNSSVKEEIKFQSGKSLPTIGGANNSNNYDFPSLGAGLSGNKPADKDDMAQKAKQMFDDLDFDDVEESGGGQGADLDFEQGSDSGDGNFNANELLNLTDYQNKRNQRNNDNSKKPSAETTQNINVKDILDPKKLKELNKIEDNEDDWDMDDDWGDEKVKDVVLDKTELKQKNLNKLGNEELAAYKRAMDKDFAKKQLKPGDPGFVYDKIVDFTKKDDGPLEDDSWDEDEEVGAQKDEEGAYEYYDEEDEEEGIQDALDKYTDKQIYDQIQNRKSNVTGEDEDYFDDDFDDDFA